jgi:hypothetical protein
MWLSFLGLGTQNRSWGSRRGLLDMGLVLIWLEGLVVGADRSGVVEI